MLLLAHKIAYTHIIRYSTHAYDDTFTHNTILYSRVRRNHRGGRLGALAAALVLRRGHPLACKRKLMFGNGPRDTS